MTAPKAHPYTPGMWGTSPAPVRQTVLAHELRPGVDDYILNVGTVVARRDEGAFVYVDVETDRWSPVTGTHVKGVETLFLHSTDEVEIERGFGL